MKKIEAIYCDFDGTITKTDTVNTFLELYTKGKWLESEKLWIEGKITSRENAVIQVGLLPEIPEKELIDFVNEIEVTDGFLEFVKYVNSKNIKFTVLSDGFDIFIQKTFEKYNHTGIPYYANHIIYEDNKFSIKFPYHNINCDIGAGMCKCEKVKEKNFCYIGDGTSDLCIAKKADTLFATKNLHEFCKANLINHYYFKSFSNIIEILEREN